MRRRAGVGGPEGEVAQQLCSALPGGRRNGDAHEGRECSRGGGSRDEVDREGCTLGAVGAYARERKANDLEVGVKELALQGGVPPIAGHSSHPNIRPLKGLKCGVIGRQLPSKQGQKLCHVDAAKSALARYSHPPGAHPNHLGF